MPFVYTEDWTFTVEGAASEETAQTQNLDTRTVSPGYFRAMRIPLIRGETFSPQDAAGAPGVVIINQTMARRFWPDQEAIGKRIKLGRADSNNPWLTVRAVVQDSAQGSLDVATKPEVYFPLAQMAGRYRRMNLAVRSTAGDPMSLIGQLQAEVRGIDKDQPVYQIQTMESLIADSVGTRRFAMTLLGLFAGLALLLAAIGIYGVMSYAVTERTHEIGIRVALGAGQKDVLKLIVGQGLVFIVSGLIIGLIGAYIATSLLCEPALRCKRARPYHFRRGHSRPDLDSACGLLHPRAAGDESRSDNRAQVRIVDLPVVGCQLTDYRQRRSLIRSRLTIHSNPAWPSCPGSLSPCGKRL